jgi:hypothetical protein
MSAPSTEALSVREVLSNEAGSSRERAKPTTRTRVALAPTASSFQLTHATVLLLNTGSASSPMPSATSVHQRAMRRLVEKERREGVLGCRSTAMTFINAA